MFDDARQLSARRRLIRRRFSQISIHYNNLGADDEAQNHTRGRRALRTCDDGGSVLEQHEHHRRFHHRFGRSGNDRRTTRHRTGDHGSIDNRIGSGIDSSVGVDIIRGCGHDSPDTDHDRADSNNGARRPDVR